uniref:Uncharacterized protein n=1 Tax=Anguilla anguilla TaxID=7936 RepID=A0A0E9REJ7_ANGAN
MVPMYAKHRDRDVQVLVLVVHPRELAVAEINSLVTQDLEHDGPISHAVLPQQFHTVVHCSTGGLVVMEKITPSRIKSTLFSLACLRISSNVTKVSFPLIASFSRYPR